jgi:hypothetical protein
VRAHHVQVLPAVDVRDADTVTPDIDLGSVTLHVFDRGEGEHAMLECLRDEIVRRYFGTSFEHGRLLLV